MSNYHERLIKDLNLPIGEERHSYDAVTGEPYLQFSTAIKLESIAENKDEELYDEIIARLKEYKNSIIGSKDPAGFKLYIRRNLKIEKECTGEWDADKKDFSMIQVAKCRILISDKPNFYTAPKKKHV